MMPFHQATMGLLDGFGRGPRLQAEHRQGSGPAPPRFIGRALIRLALIRARPAPTTAGLALLQLLLQIQHHPFRILIQPFTGPHAVQSKGRQNSRRLLGRLPADR